MARRAASRDDPGFTTYDFPVRPDLVVPLTLPVDLTPVDAARIASFVLSLAFTDAELSEVRSDA